MFRQVAKQLGARQVVARRLKSSTSTIDKFQDGVISDDANATIQTDLRDVHIIREISTEEKKNATWLAALEERKKQLAQGKVIDSYSYNTPQKPIISDKTRADSFSYIKLPLKEDEWLTDFYASAAGRFRMGQIFQDLDGLAGTVANKHVSPTKPILVTASVDRIYLLKRVDDIKNRNFIISGSVVWTGTSSMEIIIKASSTTGPLKEKIVEDDIKDEDVFLTASFTFVARNPETHRSFPINRLLPTTEKEWAEFKRAESHNAAKKFLKKSENINKKIPSPIEFEMIHKMWLESKEISKSDSNIKFMKDTQLNSTAFMQPQYRNRHSYMIFGGYLMRQTFELAYCTAAAFSHAFPRFISLDQTTFKAPVPVGSVLYMSAKVVYTEHVHGPDDTTTTKGLTHFDFNATNSLTDNPDEFLNKPGTLIQVKVDTSVKALNEDKRTQTGTFVYSYFVPTESTDENIPNPGYSSVVPETYGEMIEFLEGRRRASETAHFVEQEKLTTV